jgi:hypothetical protein
MRVENHRKEGENKEAVESPIGEQTSNSGDSEPEDSEDSTELESLEGLGMDEYLGCKGELCLKEANIGLL